MPQAVTAYDQAKQWRIEGSVRGSARFWRAICAVVCRNFG